MMDRILTRFLDLLERRGWDDALPDDLYFKLFDAWWRVSDARLARLRGEEDPRA